MKKTTRKQTLRLQPDIIRLLVGRDLGQARGGEPTNPTEESVLICQQR